MTQTLYHMFRLPSIFMALLAFLAGGLNPAYAVFDPVNDDTDIFLANPNNPDERPNVLIILDNTANWSRNVDGQAININELGALRTVVQNLTDQFNVGLMTFPETGNPNDNVAGGVVRYHIRQMTSQNKSTFGDLVGTMDGNNDKSNNNVISLVMSEAYKYFAGQTNTSTFGKEKGDWEGNTNHETSAQSVEHALDSEAAVPYNSPIAADNVCADNFIIFISNGDAAQNSSTNDDAGDILEAECPTCASIIPLDPDNRESNWTDEWAGFMANTDMNGAADGEPHVYTYVVEVDPQTSGNNPDHTALMKSTANQGKGRYFAVTSANGGSEIVTALNSIFSEIQAVNSVFASTTLPVSVNVRGTNLNQVYIGVFRPDETKSPRWFGNLKAYQLIFDESTNTLELGDVAGEPAENVTTGFINPGITSFWTASSLFWQYREDEPEEVNGVGGPSDAPDGDLVEKGGAAQQIREKFPTDQSTRNLYTCTSTADDPSTDPVCEEGDPLSETPFDTTNTGITGGTLQLESRVIEFLTALNSQTVTELTDTRDVTALTANTSITFTNDSLTAAGQLSVDSLRTGAEVGISSIDNNPNIKSIDDIQRSGNPKTEAVVTVNGHGWSNNTTIHIDGVSATDFNGSWTIKNVDANTFTITKGTDFSTANPNIGGATATRTSSSVTLVTSSPHGLTVGESATVTISGVVPTSWNGQRTVNPTDATTFTFSTGAAELPPPSDLSSGLVTTTTDIATADIPGHAFTAGVDVTISGANPTGYNGTFEVLTVNGDLITYDVGSSLGVATGSIFASGGGAAVTGTVTGTDLVAAFGTGSETITVFGASPSGFNGTFDVSVVDADTYTYMSTEGVSPSADVAGFGAGGAAIPLDQDGDGDDPDYEVLTVIPGHGMGEIGEVVSIDIFGSNGGTYDGTHSATVESEDTLSFFLFDQASVPAPDDSTSTIARIADLSGAIALATVETSRPSTYTQSGNTITVNVTDGHHGFSTDSGGSVVFLDFTSGGATSGYYNVSAVPDPHTFEVTSGVSLTTSGNVNVEGHGFHEGQSVIIEGANEAAYNVADPGVTVDVVDGYRFKYETGSVTPLDDTDGDISAGFKTDTAFATVPAHGFSNGSTVSISNASPGDFNGSFTITVEDTNTFSYTLPGLQGEAVDSGGGDFGEASGSSVDAAEVTNLINWVRGQDNLEDENEDGDFTDIRASVHGDVLHSRPAVVNYNRHGNDHDVYIFYGANDGIFRAIKGGFIQSDTGQPLPGEEVWGFIPEEFFGDLSRLRNNSPVISSNNKKPYFADGSIGVYVFDAGNDGKLDSPDDGDPTTEDDRVILYVSMHRGGRIIYAIDVSDPQDPKYLWKRTNSDWPELGQTWSVPFVTQIAHDVDGDATTEDPVLIFGAGYDPLVEDVPPEDITGFNVDNDNDNDLEIEAGAANYERSMGRGIFVVDALTGDLIFQAGGAGVTNNGAADTFLPVTGMDCAIPGDGAVLSDRNGNVDNRAYFGDTCANIWRLDFDDPDPDNWTVTKLADLDDPSTIPGGLRKFLFPPDVVYGDNFDAVLIGSGDREHPFDTTVQNKFFMIRDIGTGTTPSILTPIVPSDLADMTENCLQDPNCTGAESTAAATALDSGDGWFIDLGEGEKVVGNAVTLNNITFFNTNQPGSVVDDASCSSDLGIARQYQVNYDDATAYLDKNLDGDVTAADRSTTHPGGGYLPSPVPVVVEIDGEIYEGVISGVEVQQPPGSLLGARLRKFWYREFE